MYEEGSFIQSQLVAQRKSVEQTFSLIIKHYKESLSQLALSSDQVFSLSEENALLQSQQQSPHPSREEFEELVDLESALRTENNEISKQIIDLHARIERMEREHLEETSRQGEVISSQEQQLTRVCQQVGELNCAYDDLKEEKEGMQGELGRTRGLLEKVEEERAQAVKEKAEVLREVALLRERVREMETRRVTAHDFYAKNVVGEGDKLDVSNLRVSAKSKVHGCSANCVCRIEGDVLVGYDNGCVERLREGSLRGSFKGCGRGVNSVSTEGKFVAAGSNDFNVRIWNVETQRVNCTNNHIDKVMATAFLPGHSSAKLLSACRTIKLFDVGRLQNIQTFCPGSLVVDLLPLDLHCVISTHYDRSVRLWDTRETRGREGLRLESRITGADLVRSGGGEDLVCALLGRNLVRVDRRRWEVVETYSAQDYFVEFHLAKPCVSDQYVASGGRDGGVYLWELDTARFVCRLREEGSAQVTALCWVGEALISTHLSGHVVTWTL